MRPQSTTRRIIWAAAAACTGVLLYWACTDVYGNFDIPKSSDVATWRIGQGLQGVVGSAESSIHETNRDMQDVADGRNRLNDRRIERDTKRGDTNGE